VPTREQIIDALREYKQVARAAKSLGIGQRRMYRFMERDRLRLKAVLKWPSMPPVLKLEDPAQETLTDYPPAARVQPERNIHVLTARDFSGPCHGDAGRASFTVGADEQLGQYRRLKGYR
jgi:hypothetical protein